MGLLNYITAHSLDEDYAHVAEQKGPASPGDRRRNLHVASIVALALFGLLVTTAGVQTARSEPVRESSRDSLVAQAQERFVSTVRRSLAEAAEHPHARPWYRAVYAADEAVGFVMLSWNVEPRPPEIIGPWFLWKLLIDERQQGRGYGSAVVRQVAALVRAEGAT